MEVCTKFHWDSSNSCRDIPLKNNNANLMVAREEKSMDPQSQIHPLKQNFMAIHLVVVDLFWFLPNQQKDDLTMTFPALYLKQKY